MARPSKDQRLREIQRDIAEIKSMLQDKNPRSLKPDDLGKPKITDDNLREEPEGIDDE